MAQGSIDPEKVTKPIQLVAAWFVALGALVGAFLSASEVVQQPSWLPVLYGIAAVAFVPLFAWLVFRLQTRYRTELQEDRYYSKNLADQREQLGFAAENVPGRAGHRGAGSKVTDPADIPTVRKEIYDRQRGLFLVHTWLPSRRRGQLADITVRLHEHEGETRPLSGGEVERVEYYLGRSFFGGKAVSKTNADNAFRLDVAAYGSTDCVARVHFKDGTSVDLDRYLDFAIPDSG
jgi:hypothetical protein